MENPHLNLTKDVPPGTRKNAILVTFLICVSLIILSEPFIYFFSYELTGQERHSNAVLIREIH